MKHAGLFLVIGALVILTGCSADPRGLEDMLYEENGLPIYD